MSELIRTPNLRVPGRICVGDSHRNRDDVQSLISSIIVTAPGSGVTVTMQVGRDVQ